MLNSQAGDIAIRVSLVGDSGVGKSCLMRSYASGGTEPFDSMYTTTIGVDFEIKRMVVDGKVVNVQIWDTAGQERFRTIAISYYRTSNAILLVFDITELSTFQSLDIWYNEIQTYANEDVDIILVGNKADMESDRQVSYDMARSWAEQHNMAYIETSAKSRFNVDRTFDVLIRACVANYLQSLDLKVGVSPSIDLQRNSESDSKKDSGCC